nr:MAG TPA: hypothetical protein [Caudoviricetes sp.]
MAEYFAASAISLAAMGRARRSSRAERPPST